MNYIELYKMQLNKDDMVYETAVFKEYCALNCFLNDFERPDGTIKEIILNEIGLLNNHDLDKIDKSVVLLKESLTQLTQEKNILFEEFHIDGVLLMIGDRTIDSHGILVENKSYLVIDVWTYASSMENYNPISFLVHEMAHAIHYKINPEMYFSNYSNDEEKVIKRIFVEGLATNLTMTATDESEADVFWLGYLNKEEVGRWKAYSREVMSEYSEALGQLLTQGIWDQNHQYQLFSVFDPEKLWESRLAYYYGYEIVEIFKSKSSIKKLFTLSYEEILPVMKKYFNI